MYNVILIIHVIVVVALIGMILIQRGRSGGLVEALGGVESIFGTKTSNFLVKVTVVLSVCFFLTSISLAYLSKQKGKSLMGKYENLTTEIENENINEDANEGINEDIAQDATKELSTLEESMPSQESLSPGDEGSSPLTDEE